MGIVKDILEFFLSPLRDQFYESRKIKNQEKIEIYKQVLARIQKEKPNFLHIINKKPYNSPSHKKTIEQYSYELLKEELLKLEKISKFRKSSRVIIEKSIDNKDAIQLMNLLPKLEFKLIKKIK